MNWINGEAEKSKTSDVLNSFWSMHESGFISHKLTFAKDLDEYISKCKKVIPKEFIFLARKCLDHYSCSFKLKGAKK